MEKAPIPNEGEVMNKSIVDLLKVEIEGGYVILTPKLSRKALREHNKIMLRHAEVVRKPDENDGDKKEPEMKFNFSDLEDANDYLVLNMIQEAVVNGGQVKVDLDFIDNLNASDFENIIKNCRLIREKQEEGKKG